MTDIDLIHYLMTVEAHSVGCIPLPTVQHYHLDRGLWLPIVDRHNHKVGYLLHGPARTGKPLRIYQTVVAPDDRLLTYASRAIHALLARARAAGVDEILLRCRSNLAANFFWPKVGAKLWHVCRPGKHHPLAVNEYVIPVPPARPLFLALSVAPIQGRADPKAAALALATQLPKPKGGLLPGKTPPANLGKKGTSTPAPDRGSRATTDR